MSDINTGSMPDKTMGVYAPDEKDWFANIVFSTVISLICSSGITFDKAKEQLEKVLGYVSNIQSVFGGETE